MSKINEQQHPARLETCRPEAHERVAYCRCWKSKKFPLCDGSHREHNAETGDDLGPLVIMPTQE